MYVIATVAIVLLAGVSGRLSLTSPPPSGSLSALLRSVLLLVRDEPLLRQRMLLGAHRVRLLQHPVDVGRVPPFGRALPLRQRRDRPVRARGAGRGADGAGRRAGVRSRSRPCRDERLDRRDGRELGAARVRQELGGRADRRDRRARPRGSGDAHLEPERGVLAARTGPQPADHRLHGRLFPRGRRAVGGHVGALLERRVGRGVRARGGDRRGRARLVGRHRARYDRAAADRRGQHRRDPTWHDRTVRPRLSRLRPRRHAAEIGRNGRRAHARGDRRRRGGRRASCVFCTARPRRWMPPLAEATGHRGVAICANGAVVCDLHTESVLEASPLEPGDRPEAGGAARGRGARRRVGGRAHSGFGHEPGVRARAGRSPTTRRSTPSRR